MNYRRFFSPLLLVLSLLLPISAHAHKISIFAWPEGNELRGEVKFNGGRQAKNVTIEMQNAADKAVLATTACDEKGEFRLALSEQILKTHPDLLLVANAGEGHRGEWHMAANEYAPTSSTAPAAKAASVAAQQESVTPAAQMQTAPTVATAAAPAINEELLRRIVAEEISKGLSPLRKTLAESQNQEPSLRDILGGIGWIIGLAGMAAWGQSRRGKKPA